MESAVTGKDRLPSNNYMIKQASNLSNEGILDNNC